MPPPTDFSQDLTSDYLSRLLQPIGEQEKYGVGQARSEAAARGLSGQAFEGAAVAGVGTAANVARNKTISDFNYKLAGLNREDRLLGEQQEFQDAERQKTEDFQQQMTKLGFDFQKSEREAKQKFESQQALQGEIIGGIAGGASAAAGGYAKGRGYAAGGG